MNAGSACGSVPLSDGAQRQHPRGFALLDERAVRVATLVLLDLREGASKHDLAFHINAYGWALTHLKFILFCLAFAGCSSSESTPTPSSDADADATNTVGDAGADSAARPDATPSSAPCSFSVSGDRSYPSTDTISCQGSLSQPNGSGDFTFNIAAGFAPSSAKENVTFGLLLVSPTPPAARDTWTLGKDGQKSGNSTLTVIKGQTGTIWATSENDAALVKGGTTVTFVSVTKVMGQQQPKNVYDVFDVTVEAALHGQRAATGPVKVTGHFKVASLPIGS